jgi:CelD/BcsL family acetyltransferase involved in cellulose biosynthesis
LVTRIQEINNYGDFIALESAWKNFLEEYEHTIFSTWEWLSTWWKHFGADKRLLLLLAKDNDRIVGIAPLMYTVSSLFGLKRGKIEFIGTPDSDYNNFIVNEKKEETLRLFIEHLHALKKKWAFIDLSDIPQTAECLNFLATTSKSLKPIEKCPYLLLPESYEKFLEGLSPKKRKYIRYNMNRLQASFKVEMVDYSQEGLYTEGMQYLVELHRKRREDIGSYSSFSDPKVRSFHLNLAKCFSKENWLCLHVLKLSGKPVAAEYAFKHRSKYYAYMAGFDPEYSQYNVGNMLFISIITKLIQEGLTNYDFLRGAEPYKDYWTETSKWNYQAILCNKGPFANIKYWLYNEYWNYGNKLKYLSSKISGFGGV